MGTVNKYGRYYTLTVDLRDDVVIGQVLTVQLPFTIEFDIERKNFGVSNSARFKIYNLAPATRNSLRYNQYDFGIFRGITLQAGYTGIQPATLFNGNIHRAYSIREGSNFVTHIEAYDGGFAVQSESTFNLPKGSPYVNLLNPGAGLITSLLADLGKYNISTGIIGPTYLNMPPILIGSSESNKTFHLLDTYVGNGFFIDNQIAYCLDQGEYFTNTGLITIDSSAGLLGTPYLEDNFILMDILMEPRVMVGQEVILDSVTSDSYLNHQQYKITGIKHKGMISGAVCGDAVTTLSCLYPPEGFSSSAGVV